MVKLTRLNGRLMFWMMFMAAAGFVIGGKGGGGDLEQLIWVIGGLLIGTFVGARFNRSGSPKN